MLRPKYQARRNYKINICPEGLEAKVGLIIFEFLVRAPIWNKPYCHAFGKDWFIRQGPHHCRSLSKDPRPDCWLVGDFWTLHNLYHAASTSTPLPGWASPSLNMSYPFWFWINSFLVKTPLHCEQQTLNKYYLLLSSEARQELLPKAHLIKQAPNIFCASSEVTVDTLVLLLRAEFLHSH